jgi:peroxiredoxin
MTARTEEYNQNFSRGEMGVPAGRVRNTPVQVGDVAPDFGLPALVAGVKERFRLSDNRGKKSVVLAFYPSNWEPVSEKQMVQYQAHREEFLARDAETVGVCVDSIMNTTSWEREIGPFDFPLCSDFWPHGEAASKYGVLGSDEPSRGMCERAVFVVDQAGKIAFSKIYDLSETPDVQEPLGVLRSLQAEHNS